MNILRNSMLALGPKNEGTHDGDHSFIPKLPLVVLMVYYFFGVGYSVYTQRYYFADGAFFFLWLLQDGFLHLQKFDNRAAFGYHS